MVAIATDNDVPDLADLEARGLIVFLPAGGGNLKEWAERISGLAGLATARAYDESGSIMSDNPSNNPSYHIPFVMRRTETQVGNGVSVRPEDGTTITLGRDRTLLG